MPSPAPRLPSPVLAAIVALGLTLPAAGQQAPRLELPNTRVSADDQFNWHLPIKVANDLEAGIYADSLICTVEDLDPGETRAARTHRLSLDHIARLIPSLSGKDSTVVRYHGLALAEHARLTFRLYSHTSEGRTYVSERTVETGPGLTSRSFPSRFLEDRKHRIEYVLLPEPWPAAPSPGVLLVHGEGTHARRLMPIAWDLANLGFTVMLVSLPGYGQSSGSPDIGGPATLRALNRALDHLRRSTGVDSSRIAVWGIGRGATGAGLLAAQRRDLQGLILQSGLYDLAAAERGSESAALGEALRAEAGPRSSWKRRSPITTAARITAPVLILHGEQDREVPPSQATDLAASLRQAGRPVTLRLVPEAAHLLPAAMTKSPALEFLREHLKPSKWP